MNSNIKYDNISPGVCMCGCGSIFESFSVLLQSISSVFIAVVVYILKEIDFKSLYEKDHLFYVDI